MNITLLNCIKRETGIIAFVTITVLNINIVYATGQASLMRTEGNTQGNASDLSMQNSTTSAMSAVMNLADMNIPGAVNNGYQAYGHYQNSELLDLTSNTNRLNALDMLSATDPTAAHQILSFKMTKTSFSRLGTNYLYQGEAKAIANEFERRSGMSRKTFHNFLAQSTEQKIQLSDPNLVNKVLGRFESFVSQVPNAEFRGKLEKGLAMVPVSARSGIIAKGISKVTAMLARNNTPQRTIASETNAVVAIETAASEQAPQEEIVAKVGSSQNHQKSLLGITAAEANLLEFANRTLTSHEESIFERISHRYMQLTTKMAAN